MVRILGLDPGSYHLGYGVVESEGSRLRHVEHGTVDLPRGLALSQRLCRLFEALEQVLDRLPCQQVAVERVFTARNAASALTLGHARGVVLLVVGRRGLPIAEYTPAEVKLAVTGHGRCEKEEVAGMVGRILHIPGHGLPLDAGDALAVAICHAGAWSPDRRVDPVAPPKRRRAGSTG
jgi:crossover junction endodeoxyribonuclease RuvC